MDLHMHRELRWIFSAVTQDEFRVNIPVLSVTGHLQHETVDWNDKYFIMIYTSKLSNVAKYNYNIC